MSCRSNNKKGGGEKTSEGHENRRSTAQLSFGIEGQTSTQYRGVAAFVEGRPWTRTLAAL